MIRQQHQQLQRHYYQAANKLLFDDQRYYAPSNPLLEPTNQYLHGHHKSRRPHHSLESTRGLNHSLQSQWLYGGGRRSMAGDLLYGSQATAPVAALGNVLDADQKIVEDFCLLYNESRQLFNGLR